MPPSQEEWTAVVERYRKQLRVPCRLLFSTDVKVGRHSWDDCGTCSLTINPEVDFKRPEHLVLHEMAHHINMEPFICVDWEEYSPAVQFNYKAAGDNRYCCSGWTGGHCYHWAQTLVDIYKKTGTALPYSTGFEKFAELAGIKHKIFEFPWSK